MADLTVRLRTTLEASRTALQLSPGDVEPPSGDLVHEFLVESAYGYAKGGVFTPPDDGPAIYAFTVFRDDERQVGAPRVLVRSPNLAVDEDAIRAMIAQEVQVGPK